MRRPGTGLMSTALTQWRMDMKAFTPGPAFVAAAALAGALVFALVPALQAASPADGQPAAPGTMDHGRAATMDHSNPDEQMRAMMQHHEQMMACMHAQQMQGGAPLLPGQDAFGAVGLTVTSNRPKEVQHIRGLGFVGILVSGSHHQPHHLAMAKGEFEHSERNEHSGRAH